MAASRVRETTPNVNFAPTSEVCTHLAQRPPQIESARYSRPPDGPGATILATLARPEYVPIRTAARLTGISRELISQAIARGEISAARPGKRWIYVRLDDVREWLCEQAVTPSHQQIAKRVEEGFRRARRRANPEAQR